MHVSFNSRTLGRVRLVRSVRSVEQQQFQFTHPGKGATRASAQTTSSCSCFNSRTLGRVRQTFTDRFGVNRWFQFTHPGKGATCISTTRPSARRGFNSRPLGRVRLLYYRQLTDDYRFNSRTLGRVRPSFDMVIPSTLLFQFTHPGKGATLTD